MIGKCCAKVIHNKKPKACPGGGWCDCQHRLPTEYIIEKMKEENK